MAIAIRRERCDRQAMSGGSSDGARADVSLHLRNIGRSAALTMLGSRHFSIRTRRWRYTLCNNGEEELYDHAKDPHEWDNLADQPNMVQTKKALREQLKRLSN